MEKRVEDKTERILSIYSRLKQGQVIDRKKESEKYNVSLRTIQRDITDIQRFLSGNESNFRETIVYDKDSGGYRLEMNIRALTEEAELLKLYIKFLNEYKNEVK